MMLTLWIVLGALVMVMAARPHRLERGELTKLAASRTQYVRDLLRIRRRERDDLRRILRQERRPPLARSRG
jgi:hypothetical protein